MTDKSNGESPRTESITLGDVAAKANVSLATASRVLGDSKHPVSQRTRDQVLKAAAELGYSASPLARALASRRSRIIGVIVPDNVDSYFAEIARGVDDVANKAGYLTIIANADRESKREVEHVQMLRTYNAAGVVFAGSGKKVTDEQAQELELVITAARNEGMKIVSLATRDFPSDVITYDNVEAARSITQYLIQLGHRDIAFIDGPAGVYSSDERREGYLRALEQESLEAQIIPGNFASDSGTNAAVKLLSKGRLPDAVVGANDQTAVGAITALRHAGVLIPDEISVVGIGGTRLAALVDLTTAAVPLRDLGSAAARRIIETDSQVSDDFEFDSRVTVRQTATRRLSRVTTSE